MIGKTRLECCSNKKPPMNGRAGSSTSANGITRIAGRCSIGLLTLLRYSAQSKAEPISDSMNGGAESPIIVWPKDAITS